MFELFRQMQAHAPVPPQAPPPPPPPPPPAQQYPAAMPPGVPNAPPGTMFVPGFGFVPIERLMRAIGAEEPRSYGRPREPYYPRESGEHSYRAAAAQPPPSPSPPQKTATEQFQEALTFIRTAVEAAQEINTMIPGAVGAPSAPAPESEIIDDGPVRIVEAGPAKLAYGEDNKLRGVDSFVMNLPDIMKWGAEQMDKMRKSVEDDRQRQAAARLPPGFVEVGPGYRPPPGYVAVPIESAPQSSQGQGLPPPPADVPPPIETPWNMPTIPES